MSGAETATAACGQLALDLDFDKVLQLTAARAQTSAGRLFVLSSLHLPSFDEAGRHAQLSIELELLLADEGRLALGGIDEALPWLEPAASAPQEIGDLLHLLALAKRVAALRRKLAAAPGELQLLRSLADQLPDTTALVDWAGAKLGRDGRIPDQASPELARARRAVVRLRQQLLKALDEVRRRHGEAMTDAPPTLRRDRYCVPVRSAARGQVQGLVLSSSGSGATVYLEPYSVVELNNDLVEAAAREAEEVRRIIDEVAAAFVAVRGDLATAVQVLARLDAAQAKVLLGQMVEGRVVIPAAGKELILEGGRHPLLDERLHDLRREVLGEEERRGGERRAVPLDFRLPPGIRTLIVSGPNAGGKTIVLKTLGIMVLMAYHGIPLPAGEGTAIPALNGLWCHIGDEQSVAADLSTFSGAMASTAQLLGAADEQWLVLFDELGAGTDPLEGAALGFGLLEELSRRQCLTVATSHLASIALSADGTPLMENAAMEYDEEVGCPTYRLRLGRPGRSRALEIAAAMGIPAAIIERARELLGGAHLELDTWLRRLEQVETDLLQEQASLHRQQQEYHSKLAETEEQRRQLVNERQRLPERLAAERDNLRRRAKEQLDRALAELERATRDLKPLGRKRQQLLRDKALDLPMSDLSGQEQGQRQDDDSSALTAGVCVRVAGLPGEGTVQEVRGNRCLVTLAGKRLWVGTADLQRLTTPAQQPVSGKVRVEADEAVPTEIVLIGKHAEAAREELESFLDHAFTAGRATVRVVHGHGTGTLRRMVIEVCRCHPAVRSYRHPPQYRGGAGATEIELEGHG